MSNHVLEPQLAKTARPGSPHEATCRMFENDLLERFSRIHPATPFIAWVPVVGIFVVRSALRRDLPPFTLPGLFLGGMLAWTLAEYALHKYVFHWTNETAWGRRVHFLLHGVHHEYPSDRDRLVMPLL